MVVKYNYAASLDCDGMFNTFNNNPLTSESIANNVLVSHWCVKNKSYPSCEKFRWENSGSIFRTREKVDIWKGKKESLSIKLTTLKKLRTFFFKFRQQLLLIRMSPLSSPKFFGGNCFLSLISFMLNQKLSWNISMNMTHQKLLCGEMKLKPAWGWLTSDANKPKCQNNAGVISPTVSWGSDL